MNTELVETAKFYPFACACGSGTGPFVLTGLETHSGALYLCQPCLKRIVEAVDVVPAAAHRKLVEDAGRINGEAQQLRRDLDAAQAELAGLQAKYAAVSVDRDSIRANADILRERVTNLDAELASWRDGSVGRAEQARAEIAALAEKPKTKPKTKAGV